MKKILAALGIGSGSIAALGAFGACHTICTAAIVGLATIGITVTGMPLMFLQNPSVYIPLTILGIIMIGASVYLFTRTKTCCRTVTETKKKQKKQ